MPMMIFRQFLVVPRPPCLRQLEFAIREKLRCLGTGPPYAYGEQIALRCHAFALAIAPSALMP